MLRTTSERYVRDEATTPDGGVQSARRRPLGRAAAICTVFAALLISATGATQAQKDQEDEKTIWPTHYTRIRGPFHVDGRSFTVKLDVLCYKETKHGGWCTEDDQETMKSVKIENERGKVIFEKKFPVAFSHRVERHVVDATLLEGRERQAIELTYEQLPTHANTGVQIQVFGLQNGALKAMNEEPLDFYGELGKLPEGSTQGSEKLAADDSLPIYVLTSYFYILEPVRIDWKEFRLRKQRKGEFEVAQEAPFQRKPDVQAEGYIHLFAAPDKNASAAGVSVTKESKVDVLRALFSEGPPEAHASANETWLKIRIDGKEGWILGEDDYTAIGLTFYQVE